MSLSLKAKFLKKEYPFGPGILKFYFQESYLGDGTMPVDGSYKEGTCCPYIQG